jgi:glycosyltransferase involved in cell wall biosynthesis
VDTEAFKPLQYKRRVSNNFTCGWVGKIESEHTMEGYLEHVKPICNSVAGIDLFSAPGGEDINGPTQMLGFYNAIDVLVMFNESMGDTKCILEAMACGLPVITTRVGDVQEIIENNVNGIVISRNEAELLEALLTLKEKPEYRLKMGQLARETAVRQWDWRDVAHHWKTLFDKVMEI